MGGGCCYCDNHLFNPLTARKGICMFSPELKAQLANLQSFIVATGFILVLDVLIYKACLSVYTETYGRKEARRRAYGIGWTFTIISLPIVA